MFINFSQKKLIREYVSLYFKSKKSFNLLKEEENSQNGLEISKDFLNFNFKLINKIKDGDNSIVDNMKININSNTLIAAVLYKISKVLGLPIEPFNKEKLDLNKLANFIKFMKESCKKDGEYKDWWQNFEKFLSQNGFNIKKIIEENQLKNDYEWDTAIYCSKRIQTNGYYDPDSVKRSLKANSPDVIIGTMYQSIIGAQFNQSWIKDLDLKYVIVKKKEENRLKLIFNLGSSLPRIISQNFDESFMKILARKESIKYRHLSSWNYIYTTLKTTSDQPDWYDTLTGDEGNTAEIINNIIDVTTFGSGKILYNLGSIVLTNGINNAIDNISEKTVNLAIENIIENYFNELDEKKKKIEEEKLLKEKEIFQQKIKDEFIQQCLTIAKELNLKNINLKTLTQKGKGNPQEYQEFLKICNSLKKQQDDNNSIVGAENKSSFLNLKTSSKNMIDNKNYILKSNNVLLSEVLQILVPIAISVGVHLFSDQLQLSATNYFEKYGYYEIDLTDTFNHEAIMKFYNSLF